MPRHSPSPVREVEKSFDLRHHACLLLALFFLIFPQPVARADDGLEVEGQHAAVPSPASVFGFTPGDDRKIADWKQMTSYFARLDRASSRVQVQTLGTTTLGRPLFVVLPSAARDLQLAERQSTADPSLRSG